MKKLISIFVLIFLGSCTSNTIFEKPKNLIPKDSMSLLIQEMMIASSSKFMKNKNNQKKLEYMSLVYDRFKIDSVRFQSSNLYYLSKIDLYQEIFEDAKISLETKKEKYSTLKKELDSLKKDSLSKIKKGKIINKDSSFKKKNFTDNLLKRELNN
ncbi:DUF4296 domain-containing protein [uncultured Polaribacter sp.]|uniref:DUF4296 domain-containing protein n=1 Tax=uncultured Polaribacter sp. TaxID=174711 RepID=UPI00262DEB8A|nr:DUF4296 domain-containing protein [uncultured Polaribacter sp.]